MASISIVIPVFNEKESVPVLHDEIIAIVKKGKLSLKEIIFVNDGSTDGTLVVLQGLAKKHKKVKAVNFWRNYGQTAAMAAGIDQAEGDIVIMMDGDLQNNPEDIPAMLEKLDDGWDVVSGWRKDRKDNSFTRTFPSRVANWLISFISRVSLHDYGCSLKVYRREVLDGVRLYGEMHRFIPIHASWQGAKVTEMVVNHRSRQFGHSNYGLERTFKVLLDLILIAFMHKFLHKPMHVFGGIGLAGLFASVGSLGWAIVNKFNGMAFVTSPLIHMSATFFIFGTMSILMGLLSEMIMRTYFESQSKNIYRIKNIFE